MAGNRRGDPRRTIPIAAASCCSVSKHRKRNSKRRSRPPPGSRWSKGSRSAARSSTMRPGVGSRARSRTRPRSPTWRRGSSAWSTPGSGRPRRCQGRLRRGTRACPLPRTRSGMRGAPIAASQGTGRRAPHRACVRGRRHWHALRAAPAYERVALRSRAPSLVRGRAHRDRRHGPVLDLGLRADGRAGADRHGVRLRGALHGRRTLPVAQPRLDDARRAYDRRRGRHGAARGLRRPGRDGWWGEPAIPGTTGASTSG